MSSSSQPHHAGTSEGSSVVNPDSTTPTTSLNPDSGKHGDPSEHIKDAAKGSPEAKRAAADRMTENVIYALLEDKRRELDAEIAAFKAAKDEEFRIFERDLREGRSVGVTKKKGRDAETFHTVKKRHRGNGYGVSSSPSNDSSSPKALATHFSNEGRSLRNHHLSGDQTPQQTPPHEREHEFQGLFTPTYMPWLDCGEHRSLDRPKLERPARPSPSEYSPTSSRLEEGGSAPLTQPSFTRPALPKLTLPNSTRSASLPSAPQQPTTLLSRRSGSTTSLQSSIRQSSDDQKPRAAKRVKFKFDDIIVLPTAPYDRSQEPIANMSDNTERITDQEFDDMQRGVQQVKIISPQKMFSTSPLSESSPSRSPNFSKLASESGPSGLPRDINHEQPSQMEGNESLDGLGGKWSTIKEKDVVGGSGAVQDESAEVISRAEYEEAEDEDDYADGGLFDLDETMADLPEPKEPKEKMENGNGAAIASAANMPPLSPSSFRGYDLSLVIPTTIGSLADRYGPSLNRVRPGTLPSSVPTDIGFGSKRPRNSTEAGYRSTGSGNGNLPTNRSYASQFKEESDIRWSSMRRRSSAKYDVADPEDEPAKSKRLVYRNRATISEEHGDEEDLALSPMAASVPVQIPPSPVMGYTDNGDMDSNSCTPKAKSEKGSGPPRKGKKSRDGGSATAIPTTNEPTATNTFSLSTSAGVTSVDNPITDQFATATIGGLHRNAFGTGSDDQDGLGSYSSSVGNGNFMSNPFVSGSYASPGAIALAEAAADVGSYVGSIDGCSGYDPADRSSYLKLKRGRNGGEPQSFGERMMLEDEKKAKKPSEKTKEKKNGRRATQP